MKQIKFTVLSKPVSVNSCYSQSLSGHRFMTNEGKQFKSDVAKAASPYSGIILDTEKQKLSVSITYHFRTSLSDIDGSNKLVLDAMQGIFYKNDRQVQELHCFKFVDKESPRIEITIEEYKSKLSNL